MDLLISFYFKKTHQKLATDNKIHACVIRSKTSILFLIRYARRGSTHSITILSTRVIHFISFNETDFFQKCIWIDEELKAFFLSCAMFLSPKGWLAKLWCHLFDLPTIFINSTKEKLHAGASGTVLFLTMGSKMKSAHSNSLVILKHSLRSHGLEKIPLVFQSVFQECLF